MKTLFIALAALLVGLSLAVCGCASDSGTLDGTGLTPAEQTSLNFILAYTPELEDISDKQFRTVSALTDGDFNAAAALVDSYVDQWNRVKHKWESFPAAGGKVTTLERLFEDTANDLHDVHSGISDAIEYGDSSAGVLAVEQYGVDMLLLKEELAKFTGTSEEETDY